MRRWRLFIAIITILIAGWVMSRGATAGGWATIVLDALPLDARADQPLEVGFVLLQHGIRPASYFADTDQLYEPVLTAHNEETGETVTAEAIQRGDVGHFVATVIFPSPGLWQWKISTYPLGMDNQFEPLQVLPAISVANEPPSAMSTAAADLRPNRTLIGAILAGTIFFLAAADSIPLPPSEVDQLEPHGKALFVAKSCVACHAHPAVSSYEFDQAVAVFGQGPWSGPDFAQYQSDPEFMRAWLRDPQAIRPNTTMPNLNLSEAEIEVLIDFIAAANPDN